MLHTDDFVVLGGTAAYGLTQLADAWASKTKLGADRPFAFL